MAGTQIHRSIGPQVPALEVGERGELSTSRSAQEIYQVTAGRKLKLTNIIITNYSATAKVGIYDSTSTVSNRILELVVGAERSVILGPEDLIGVKEVISSIVANSTISGTFLAIGGFESPA